MNLKGAGPELAARRRERGETLEDAATALRIDPRHLEALEAADPTRLPDGPFAAGWLRLYREHLGLPVRPDPRVSPRRLDPNRVPLWAVRSIAGGAALLAALMALVYLLPRRSGGGTPEVPIGEADQHVVVTARRNAGLTVLVDGAVVYDGTLPGGERLEVTGNDRVEVHVTAAEAARVEYNGEVIEPQGRQDVPRRLVFVDDLATEP